MVVWVTESGARNQILSHIGAAAKPVSKEASQSGHHVKHRLGGVSLL